MVTTAQVVPENLIDDVKESLETTNYDQTDRIVDILVSANKIRFMRQNFYINSCFLLTDDSTVHVGNAKTGKKEKVDTQRNYLNVRAMINVAKAVIVGRELQFLSRLSWLGSEPVELHLAVQKVGYGGTIRVLMTDPVAPAKRTIIGHILDILHEKEDTFQDFSKIDIFAQSDIEDGIGSEQWTSLVAFPVLDIGSPESNPLSLGRWEDLQTANDIFLAVSRRRSKDVPDAEVGYKTAARRLAKRIVNHIPTEIISG